MKGRRWQLALLVFLHLSQGPLAAAVEVKVSPRYLVSNPGEQVDFMCKLDGKLDSCRFQMARGSSLVFKPGREKDGIRYLGKGLDQGECGISIEHVEEKHNGHINCSLVLDSTDPTEHHGHMQLVVAIPPQKPFVKVNLDPDLNNNIFKQGQGLSATCVAPNSRPASNITLYYDDQLVSNESRDQEVTCLQKSELCTSQITFNRTLDATDNNKTVRCLIHHQALLGTPIIIQYLIQVYYPPKEADQPSAHFGLVEGVAGRVPLLVESNPKPAIIWSIGDENVYEKHTSGRFTVEPTVQKAPGQYETVLLIETLSKEDTEMMYVVIATNELGQQRYPVSLSTNPGPKVLETDTGLIVIIVAAVIVFLLTLGGVFYARAKGKLCFSMRNAEKRVASPSEGTENPAVNHHASSEYINNSQEPKKEKPKEDTPV